MIFKCSINYLDVSRYAFGVKRYALRLTPNAFRLKKNCFFYPCKKSEKNYI
jgi:hypothetical protein